MVVIIDPDVTISCHSSMLSDAVVLWDIAGAIIQFHRDILCSIMHVDMMCMQ